MKSLIFFIGIFPFLRPCFSQDLPLAFPGEISTRGSVTYYYGAPFTGILIDENTNKKIGEYKNGYKNGLFTEYFQNGQKKSEGNYINGTKEGIHKEWFENGNLNFELGFSNGAFHGIYRVWHSNGQLNVEYNFILGNIADGDYIVYLENGQIALEESFRNNQKVRSIKYQDGVIIESFEMTTEYYPNGQKKSGGISANGEKDGFWAEWYENGQKMSEGNYANGIKNGTWADWYENGQKMSEGTYKDDKEHGKWTCWDEGGKKSLEGNFIDGKINGQGFIARAGLTYTGEFFDGKMNGQGKMTEGDDTYIGGFKDNKKEGYGTSSNSDGSVTYKGEWKNGKRHGKGTYKRKWRNGNFEYYDGYFAYDKYDGEGTLKEYAGGFQLTSVGEFKNGKLFTGVLHEINPSDQELEHQFKDGEGISTKFIKL